MLILNTAYIYIIFIHFTFGHAVEDHAQGIRRAEPTVVARISARWRAHVSNERAGLTSVITRASELVLPPPLCPGWRRQNEASLRARPAAASRLESTAAGAENAARRPPATLSSPPTPRRRSTLQRRRCSPSRGSPSLWRSFPLVSPRRRRGVLTERRRRAWFHETLMAPLWPRRLLKLRPLLTAHRLLSTRERCGSKGFVLENAACSRLARSPGRCPRWPQ